MNEVRHVVIGYEFNADFTQICYYDRSLGEPVSVSEKPGTNDFRIPTKLCFREEQRDWVIGTEAEAAGREPGGFLIEDLFERIMKNEATSLGRSTIEAADLLSIYLQLTLSLLGLSDQTRNIDGVMFTTKEITSSLVSALQAAMLDLGFSKEQVAVIDEEESFYFYCFSQKKEISSRRMALFSFEGNSVSAKILTKDTKLRPVVVSLLRLERISLPELPDEKDEAFSAYIQSALGEGGFSSIYLTGEAFDPKWAVKSVNLLCRMSRHVFAGDNLYVKGACYALLDRFEHQIGAGHLFLGKHRLSTNVGMKMLILGNRSYHPILSAGANWYEAETDCEFLLEGEPSLTFDLQSMEGGDPSTAVMELKGLPKRPDGATRLHLHCRCLSPREAELTVIDLGFGELFEKSGMVYKETVRL